MEEGLGGVKRIEQKFSICGGGIWSQLESFPIQQKNHTLSMMDVPPIKALIPFSNPMEETLMGLRNLWMEGGQVLTLMK